MKSFPRIILPFIIFFAISTDFTHCYVKNTIHLFKSCFEQYGLENPASDKLNISLTDSIFYHPELIKYDIIRPESFLTFSFGVFVNGLFNKYQGEFSISEYRPSNPGFDKGSAIQFSGGIFTEAIFIPDCAIQLRVAFENKSALMKIDNSLPIINEGYAGFEHSLTINLHYLSLDVLLKYNFLKDLYFIGGASYGIPLQHRYEYKVDILSGNVSYENGATEKIIANKNIINVKPLFSLKGGFGFSFPIVSDIFYLSPELNLEIPITKIITDSKLKVNSFSGALIFRYDF
jgi:hypothetical protein